MSIPVRNIYFILSYAWKYYRPSDLKKVDTKDFRNETEFFAELFVIILTKYLKKGLHQDYILRRNSIQTIKGKVDFNKSMKLTSLGLKELECQYDEYSSDIAVNQLIYATMMTLLKANINADQKKSIKKKMVYFNGVANVQVNRDLLSNVKPVRGNNTLNFLLSVSKYIHSNVGFDEQEGKFDLTDFTQSGMGLVFENFVYNFYETKLPSYTVRSGEGIPWDSPEQDSLYPAMKTDITIRKNDAALIIDTKFYQNMFNTHYHSPDKQKFISNNIYQLYTYVSNFKSDVPVEGMLLYPNTSSTVRNERIVSGKRMLINNINLNQDWKDIETELISLIV
jgi:5-methylcytosine-specific restriction enzyme subunit McrC